MWSPDGTRIVFAARPDGVLNLHLKPSSGADAEEPVLPPGPLRTPTDWSSDARHILFQQDDPKTRTDLWILEMPDRKPIPYLQTEFVERSGRFSRDGRWVAYVSNESGRNEVDVRPFPAPSERWQISIDGGTAPQWRGDGKELFYVAPNGTFMSVTVKTAPRFEPGLPLALFTAPPINIVINWPTTLKK